MKDDRLYLHQMQDAVIRNVEVIGEAAELQKVLAQALAAENPSRSSPHRAAASVRTSRCKPSRDGEKSHVALQPISPER